MSDIENDKQKIADYWDLDVLDDGEQIADILTIAERAINRVIADESTIESQKEEIERLREIQQLLIFNEEIRELTPMQKMSLSMNLLSQEG